MERGELLRDFVAGRCFDSAAAIRYDALSGLGYVCPAPPVGMDPGILRTIACRS